MFLLLLSLLLVIVLFPYFILGLVTTLVGQAVSGSVDGTGTNAQLSIPYGLTVNPAGTLLYIASKHAIRLFNIASGKRVQ